VFYWSGLKSIEIPCSVVVLGKESFYGCDSLESATFESGSRLERIEESVFHGSGLKSIEIPSSIVVLRKSSFYGCKSLELVTFESGCRLERIEEYAFHGSGLKSIEIPSSVVVLGKSSFLGCRSGANGFVDREPTIGFLGHSHVIRNRVSSRGGGVRPLWESRSEFTLTNRFGLCWASLINWFVNSSNITKFGLFLKGLGVSRIVTQNIDLRTYRLNCDGWRAAGFDWGVHSLKRTGRKILNVRTDFYAHLYIPQNSPFCFGAEIYVRRGTLDPPTLDIVFQDDIMVPSRIPALIPPK
jgi:hypothetical protein